MISAADFADVFGGEWPASPFDKPGFITSTEAPAPEPTPRPLLVVAVAEPLPVPPRVVVVPNLSPASQTLIQQAVKELIGAR